MALTPEEQARLESLRKARDTFSVEEPSVFQRVGELSEKPRELSREGLTTIAGSIPEVEPTGNLARDVALGTPKIVAETLAEVAPEFVSPLSIATSGTLGSIKGVGALAKTGKIPALTKGVESLKEGARSFGGGVADIGEKITGLGKRAEGVLRRTFKDPARPFRAGPKAAGKKFEQAKLLPGEENIASSLKGPQTNRAFLNKAVKMAEDGNITSEEALAARQVVDDMADQLPGPASRALRKLFDKIAKPTFEEADEAFKIGRDADSLRKPFPINAQGGFDTGKAFFGAAAAKFGSPMLGAQFIPAVAGAEASLLGLISKLVQAGVRNPVKSGPIVQAIASILEEEQRR